MIELKSAEEIDRMAVTGQFVGELLAELREVAAVGVNLMDLEHHARRRIRERGAESCYWDYTPSFGRGPFRNVLCLSSTTPCCTACRATTPCATVTY